MEMKKDLKALYDMKQGIRAQYRTAGTKAERLMVPALFLKLEQ